VRCDQNPAVVLIENLSRLIMYVLVGSENGGMEFLTVQVLLLLEFINTEEWLIDPVAQLLG